MKTIARENGAYFEHFVNFIIFEPRNELEGKFQ